MHGVLSNPEKKTVQWCCSKYEESEKGCSSCVDIVGFPVGTKYLVDRVRWCLGGHVCFEITYLQALIRPFRLTFSSKHPTTLFLYSSYTQKKHDFRVHVDFYVGFADWYGCKAIYSKIPAFSFCLEVIWRSKSSPVCVPVQFVRTYLHTAVVFCSGQEETKCEMGFVNNILMMHESSSFMQRRLPEAAIQTSTSKS